MIDVIAYASGGEVAQARHRIGNVRYSTLDFDYNQAVEDLFTLLWAFTRIDAVRRTLPPLALGPARLLRESVQPWARDWLANDLEEVCTRINQRKPEPSDDLVITWSLNGLRALAGWC